MANPTHHPLLRPVLALLLGAGLTACSGPGNNPARTTGQPAGTGLTVSADAPASFLGTWVRDEPKRTPPALEPDHYERIEYEISRLNDLSTGPAIRLTKWASVLDIKTRQQLFRAKLLGPIACTYIPNRACLACGSPRQFVQDSLFLTGGRLVNASPDATTTATGKPLVLSRKP